MSKLFPFWWLVSVAAITDLILNGDFEDGEAPWVWSGGAFRDSAMHYHGDWSAYIPTASYGYIEQTLTYPCKGVNITVATCALYNGGGWDSAMVLTLYYDDGTSESFVISAPLNEWAIVDFLSHINTAKILTKIRFGASYPASWFYSIDLVILKGWV
jgi:hypothetical protein